MTFGVDAIRDCLIENHALTSGENERWRRIRGDPVHHGHPEDAPTQQAEDRDQID